MEPRDATRVLLRLIRTVGLLALPQDAQVECLRKMGVAPVVDELALEFHDQILLLDTLVADGFLDAVEAAGLRSIDAELEEMSGRQHQELWTSEGLDRPEWETVRSHARAWICRL